MAIKGDHDESLLPAHHGITDGCMCSGHPAPKTVPESLPPLETASAMKPHYLPGAAIGGSNMKPSGNKIGSGL